MSHDREPQGGVRPHQPARRRLLVASSAILVGAACLALAQVPQPAPTVAPTGSEEDAARSAARTYYEAVALGDATRALAVTGLPMTVISNGVVASRSEAQMRAMLGRVAARSGAAPLSEEERARAQQRIAGTFDEAEVAFIGANTASVTLLVGSGTGPEEGDLIAMLLLYRRASQWRVIGEVIDSAPVPRSYLPAAPPPPAPK